MRYFRVPPRSLAGAVQVTVATLCLSLAGVTHAAKFDASPLTSNLLIDSGPRVSGWGVTWWEQTSAASSSREVFYYDGIVTTPLTNNAYIDQDPVISGNHVAWWAQTGADASTRQVFLYDGQTVTPLTNDALRNELPKISGSNVIWQRGSVANQEIVVYNGSTAIGLGVGAEFNVTTPSVNGQYVAWSSSGGLGHQIKLYDGVSTSVVATSALALNNPVVNETGAVAWEGFINTNIDGSGREIFYRNGATTTNLSNNSIPDFAPQISGNDVVWWQGVFPNQQIYANYNGVLGEISTNPLRDQNPQISNGKVVWIGNDGTADQIFYYDGSSITKLTSGSGNKSAPQISGAHVVWQAEATGGAEIFQAIVYPAGDENKDGRVDISDVTIAANHWLGPGPAGDANNDGIVNIVDITIMANHWLQTLDMPPAPPGPVPVVVPEPAPLSIALCGALLFTFWQIRRAG
jgi:hypothetical protein